MGRAYLLHCRAAEDAQVKAIEDLKARELTQAEEQRLREQREKVREERQLRRTRRWQTAATLVLILSFSAMTYAGWLLVKERRVLGREQSLMLARIGEQFLMEGDKERAFPISVLASRESALFPSSPEGRAIFESVVQSMVYRSELNLGPRIVGVVFSKDQSRILTWSSDEVARLWDAKTGQQIGADLPYADGARFSKDESHILTWSARSYDARVSDAATGAQIGNAIRHRGPVKGARISNDGTRVLTWSGSEVWDTAWGQEIAEPMQHESDLITAIYFQNDRRVLTLTANNTALLWDASTGTQVGETLSHDGTIIGAVVSRDSSRVLTWSEDSTARVWDSSTGIQLGEPLRHDATVNDAAFSRDESRILTWSEDKSARVWNTATGEPELGPLQHLAKVNGAAFSPDETRILSWSEDKTVQLWDAATGKNNGKPLRHDRPVRHAVFSKDGSRILTRDDKNTARLWDSTTGLQIGPSLYHEGQLLGAAFSIDETHVITWGSNNTAHFWDTSWWEDRKSLNQMAEEVCTRANSVLSATTSKTDMTSTAILVDETIVRSAPILRGREGENVCASYQLDWWDQPVQTIVDWTRMN
jgi:WD40 repeat protein